jgi:hypothetical protein
MLPFAACGDGSGVARISHVVAEAGENLAEPEYVSVDVDADLTPPWTSSPTRHRPEPTTPAPAPKQPKPGSPTSTRRSPSTGRAWTPGETPT